MKNGLIIVAALAVLILGASLAQAQCACGGAVGYTSYYAAPIDYTSYYAGPSCAGGCGSCALGGSCGGGCGGGCSTGCAAPYYSTAYYAPAYTSYYAPCYSCGYGGYGGYTVGYGWGLGLRRTAYWGW